jgi:peroxiredoxin 2/4
LDHAMEKFKRLNTVVVGVSIDSQFTHHAWRNTPVAKGGIGPVKYTLAADIAHTICRSYGVETEGGVALRGAFIIDRQNVVRAQIVNDLPLGRNIEEIIRLLEAVQFHEANGEVCPANWNKGDVGMKASPEGVAKYLAENVDRL